MKDDRFFKVSSVCYRTKYGAASGESDRLKKMNAKRLQKKQLLRHANVKPPKQSKFRLTECHSLNEHVKHIKHGKNAMGCRAAQRIKMITTDIEFNKISAKRLINTESFF